MNSFHGCTEVGANFHFLVGIFAGLIIAALVALIWSEVGKDRTSR